MPDPQPDLARLLRHAFHAMERAMMEAAASAGLDMLRPGHMTVLRHLNPDDRGMRVTDLAADAGVTRQAIQQVVDDLRRLEIVEITPDPDDRRARRVRYTDWGRQGYLRCMQEFVALEAAYLERFGDERMAALKSALAEIATPGSSDSDGSPAARRSR